MTKRQGAAVETAAEKPKKRIGFVDEVRGFAILCMVVYHTWFDLVTIFHVDLPFLFTPEMNFVRDLFAGLFIFISGAACRLSRSNLKRGFICLCGGLILTAVTYFFLPEEKILFGILHFLGLSMILFALLQKLIDKIKFPIIGMLVFGLLFVLTCNIKGGVLSFGGLFLVELPDFLYQTDILFPLGFHSENFFSSDYFPLIPWFFIFLIGSYFGVLLVKHRLPKFFYKDHIRFLSFIGRHTFIIYLLHQPVVYGVLYLIFHFVLGQG